MRWMVAADSKFGGNRGLIGAVAQKAGLCPFSQGEAERVEENRLSCAGLAGQYAQPRVERQIQPIDQNNLADAQPEQHSSNNIGAFKVKPAPTISSSGRLRADFLTLKDDVGDRENHDRRRYQTGKLRPDQQKALRHRQRRAEQCPLDLAVEYRTEGTGRRL